MTNKEAIKYLKQLKYDYNPLCPQREALRLAIRALEERPKGKWIEVDNGLVSGRCSLCGWEAVIMETDVCGMSFCPNCGANMVADLCSICKHGDNCERSDKGISFANHSVCWKFER